MFSCGWGGLGQCGHGGQQDEWVPRMIESLAAERVTQVSAGEDYSVFVTEGGGALSCGWNYYGRLGQGPGVGNVTVPAAVVAEAGLVFTRAVAGSYSTLLLDSTGAAWACGGSPTHGAFTAEVGESAETPTLLPGVAGHGTVVGVALGGDHESALLLCSDGTVLGCGYDKTHNGTVPGRLPGAALPENNNGAVALTPLPALHR